MELDNRRLSFSSDFGIFNKWHHTSLGMERVLDDGNVQQLAEERASYG